MRGKIPIEEPLFAGAPYLNGAIGAFGAILRCCCRGCNHHRCCNAAWLRILEWIGSAIENTETTQLPAADGA